MRKHRQHIFTLLTYITIVSATGSITHYHSEGLECLQHADEAHIVQTENTCPICTLVVSTDFDPIIVSTDLNTAVETIDFFDDRELLSPSFLLAPGRSPPFMI